MNEEAKKRVDQDWKDRIEKEKHSGGASPGEPSGVSTGSVSERPEAGPEIQKAGQEEGAQPARFDVFVSGLAMEGLIALGELPHPVTRKTQKNIPQAKYLIDLLGVLEEKTSGNLAAEEAQLLGDTLYQLRIRYMAKVGAKET